jgi:hypothetical protein
MQNCIVKMIRKLALNRMPSACLARHPGEGLSGTLTNRNGNDVVHYASL